MNGLPKIIPAQIEDRLVSLQDYCMGELMI